MDAEVADAICTEASDFVFGRLAFERSLHGLKHWVYFRAIADNDARSNFVGESVVKSVLGFRQFHLRGLKNVSGEWTLVSMAWNLKRLFHLRRQQTRPVAGNGADDRKHR